MTKQEFEWDNHNTRHVIHDHPERGNTVAEVESIFADPNKIIKFNRFDTVTNEARFFVLGKGTSGIVKYVAFVERIGKIRPITCYPAKPKLRATYDEGANKKSSEK